MPSYDSKADWLMDLLNRVYRLKHRFEDACFTVKTDPEACKILHNAIDRADDLINRISAKLSKVNS